MQCIRGGSLAVMKTLAMEQNRFRHNFIQSFSSRSRLKENCRESAWHVETARGKIKLCARRRTADMFVKTSGRRAGIQWASCLVIRGSGRCALFGEVENSS